MGLPSTQERGCLFRPSRLLRVATTGVTQFSEARGPGPRRRGHRHRLRRRRRRDGRRRALWRHPALGDRGRRVFQVRSERRHRALAARDRKNRARRVGGVPARVGEVVLRRVSRALDGVRQRGTDQRDGARHQQPDRRADSRNRGAACSTACSGSSSCCSADTAGSRR